ncbi:MAG: YhdT family protein [Treponema sp.]
MNNYRKQLNKEALLTVGLYLLYFGWWYFFAYYFGEQDVSKYRYILGLPEWFFYSCVLGLVVINFLVFLVVTFCFHDMPLDKEEKEC